MKRSFLAAAALFVVLLAAVLWLSHAPPQRSPRTNAPAAHTPVAPTRVHPLADASVAPPARPSRPAPRALTGEGTVVVSGPWGSDPGGFGRTLGDESNPEGPMALSLAPDGSVLVVDQINRRIQRFSHGALVSSLGLPSATTQDVTVSRDGTVVSLDRLVAREVRVHFANGETRTAPVEVGPIREGGAVSAVFVDAEGVWVEREHQEVVRVANGAGDPSGEHTTLWGRPTRDGRHLLRAAIADRAAGVVRVSAASRDNGAMDWATPVTFGASVLQVLLLDADLAGRVYIGAEVARVIDGPTPIFEEVRVEVVRLDDAGAVVGTIRLPPLPGAQEVFRPLAIDDAGAVYMMVSGARGLEVRRWEF